MSIPLIWSAINISDGCRVEALTELADALQAAEIDLADWSADADHNRSVFSLIGDPDALLAGMRLIFAWAAEHIDLREHVGRHPRLGAIDVVPFAPLGETTMEQAKTVSRQCAEAIANEFEVPIFLYRESSASTELPLTLPYLRRGGLQALRERLQAGEVRNDFGPNLVHPQLGVSIFGARPPLVAYNCVLDTTNLEVGKSIASAVRESGGGLRGLQALAFPLAQRGGAVQISMNLIDPSVAPPHLAYLEVCKTAQQYGVAVTSSELIGLVPQEALRAAFRHFLKLDDLRPNQVVEENLMRGRK